MSIPCRWSLCALLLCGTVMAHPGGHGHLTEAERYAHALELLESGRDESGMALLEALARSGHRPAQYRVFERVTERSGDRTPWLWRLVGPLDAASQHRLALRWLRGDGVEVDAGNAAFWLREAAGRGHTASQVLLAGMLDRGDGLVANGEEARLWLERAALSGSTEAQYRFGLLLTGEEGRRWITRAARSGHSRAQRWLGLQYARGGAYPTDETLSLRWLEQAADAGDARAMLLAGLYYLEGRGTESDAQRAYEWLKRAELAGEPQAVPIVRRLERELDLNERVAALTEAIDERLPDPLPLGRFDHQFPANQLLGYGSGFWISGDGLLLTNHHVVDSCTELRLPGLGKVELVASEPGNDIALLRAPAAPDGWASLRRTGPDAGEAVTAWTVAHPDSDFERRDRHAGAVRALERPGHDGRYFRFDARLEQGASGAPVFDGAGRTVGLVVAKLSPAAAYRETGVAGEPATYALKPELIRGFLEVHGLEPAPPASSPSPEAIVVRVECWY